MKKRNYIKYIIPGALCMFLIIPAIAQKSGIGIKGGLSMATLNIPNSDENNLLPGFNVGFLGRIMITENIGLQPEILFSSKGVDTYYSENFLGFNIADGETKLRINYIDIPLYLVFFPIPNFDIHLGPYIGFLMNSAIDTQTEILDFINIDNEDDVDRSEFNQLDAGLSMGLAFNYEFLMLGVNYSIGLREVAKESGNMEDLLDGSKNGAFQLYLGLIF